MIPTVDYDLVGSYNNQRVSGIDAERSVNLFEYIDQRGKKQKTLLPTSGLEDQVLTFPGAANGWRGQFVFNNVTYGVIGANVYRWTGLAPPTQINTAPLTATVGYVGIDANTYQIIFVDGTRGYIYDTLTGIWRQITDANFPNNPVDVCYLDGFFIVASGGTNNFYMSSFNQGLIWGLTTSAFTMGAATANIVIASNTMFPVNAQVTVAGSTVAEIPNGTYYVVTSTALAPTIIQLSAILGGIAIVSVAGGTGTVSNLGQLQVGSITSHPGTIVGCRTLHRNLFLFSQNFTEVWQNAGLGTNLPVRRNNSMLMEVGTPSVGSIATGFDYMLFLSQDKDGLGAVMMVSGASAIPVSNRALDFQLAQYASDSTQGVADARGIMIKENGLIFYRLNFTLANHTFVYCLSMSDQENPRWHEEELLGGDRHPAQTHGYMNGKNYYGNYLTPTLYQVDDSFNTNAGEAIRRMRIGKAIVNEGYQRRRIDRWWIDLTQGQVEDSGTNVAPIVFLSISKDGGQSYGNLLIANMGQIGQRTFRTVFRKLGVIPRGQAFVPKVEFFNQIPFNVLGAAWASEVLPE